MKAARRALQAGFASLPTPENNFELAEDEEDEEEGEEQFLSEEDAAERDAKLKAAREREEQLELARRSSVVKQGLPRPVAVDPTSILADLNETIDENDELSEALRAVNLEVALLMRHDTLAHPLPGTSVPGNTASDYDMPEDDRVAEARKTIHLELATSLGLPGASEDQVKIIVAESVTDEAFAENWAKQRQGMLYSPLHDTWVDISDMSAGELRSAYTATIHQSTERMIAEATKASKAEKKLGKQLGGYQALNAKVRKSILETMEEIHSVQRDLETFRMLKGLEEAGAPGRLEKKRMEVGELEKRERDLQARYAEINDERRGLVESIEQVSPPSRENVGGADCFSTRKIRLCWKLNRLSMRRAGKTMAMLSRWTSRALHSLCVRRRMRVRRQVEEVVVAYSAWIIVNRSHQVCLLPFYH